MDLFGAGSETVRTSILWFIYCMAAFPDVQKRVQKEIMEVLGSERRPEYLDLKSMPYTHTVIMEIMRWKTIVPLNLMHCTVADTTVGGYDIPKGTIVIANFGNVHHDPRYWKEPEKFKPERFLSEDGKSIVKSSNFMPFSLGAPPALRTQQNNISVDSSCIETCRFRAKFPHLENTLVIHQTTLSLVEFPHLENTMCYPPGYSIPRVSTFRKYDVLSTRLPYA
ncbi:cytochrome P450 2J2 [Caerostris extrusa]|uniref:Cytochrome P450 2J2 n=1 Tax=Caerostris extrusa TaxID=172846 RepID=A0AAV4XBY6_CAEEX|nr:cytochrome P450 2J2 [Caerostris extrusa]